MTRLAGKVAVIAGAAGGIGSAVARAFAQEGAVLALADVRPGPLAALAAAIGPAAHAFPVDLAQELQVEGLFYEVVHRLGGVDVLVNAAGGKHFAPITETTTAEWLACLRQNLTAPFWVARAAFKAMLAQGGTMIHLSSVAGLDAKPWLGAYAAAKFGLRGLSRALAREGLPHGIRSYCLCPGPVDTPFTHGMAPPETMIRPEDVAEAAVYLAGLGPNVAVHDLVMNRVWGD